MSKIIIEFGESVRCPRKKFVTSSVTFPSSISMEPKQIAVIMLAKRNIVNNDALKYNFLLSILRESL